MDLESYYASPLFQFRPWEGNGKSPQREFLSAFRESDTIIYRGGNRSGKDQPVSEPVLTPDGWRPIGCLQVGDEVIAGDGTIVRVTGVFPQGVKPIYELTFDDGAKTRCGKDHLWLVRDRDSRFPRKGKEGGYWRIMSLREITDAWGDNPVPLQRVAIPVCVADFRQRELPIDPYVLGVLLGDGGMADPNGSITVTKADEPLMEEVRSLLPPPLEMIRAARYTYRISGYGRGSSSTNPVREALVEMGLVGKRSWEKWIPQQYLFASPAQRLSLLQGLLDTDGTVAADGHEVSFTSTSQQLADDCAFLVRSLGGKAFMRTRITKFTYKGIKKDGRRSWTVGVRLPKFKLFRLLRKHIRCTAKMERTDLRLLTNVRPVGEEESVCIAVGHPGKTYVTRDFIVTHNTTVGAVSVAMMVQGVHPFSRFRCPMKGWVSGVDWEQGIGAVAWPALQPWIDQKNIKAMSWVKSAPPNPIPRSMSLKCGCQIDFKSADSGPEKYAGAELQFVWMDEEQPDAIQREARARLLRTRGYFIATLTPVARMEWVRELEKKNSTKVIRASILDIAASPLFPLEARQGILDYLGSLPARERKVREMGDYVALEGLVYPEFDRELHCLTPRGSVLSSASGDIQFPWPLPESWPRFAGMDFGMDHPAAVVIICRDPNKGILIVEKVWRASMVRPSEWALILKRALPRLDAPMYCDHDLAARMELQAGGIATQPANKEVEAGLDTVGTLLHGDKNGIPKLMFVVHGDTGPRGPDHRIGRCDAKSLVDEMENYRFIRDREGNPRKGTVDKRNEDACDAMRYCVIGVIGRRLTEPPSSLLTPQLFLGRTPFWKDKRNPMRPPNPGVWRPSDD